MRKLEQIKKDSFIQVDIIWFDNDLIVTYNKYAILIYCHLSKHISKRNEFIFTLNYIYSLLNIPINDPTRQNQIKSVLSEMQEDKLILLSDVDFKKLKCSELVMIQTYEIKDQFIMLYDFEFDTIMDYKEKVDKSKLLAIFLYIKKCINQTTKVAFPSYDTLCEVCGIGSHHTVKTYIDILKDLGLLLYHSRDAKVYKDGEIRKFNNVYAMNYEGYQTYIDKYNEIQDEKEQEYYDKQNKKKEANKKRSAKMKKNFTELDELIE
jgi:hypothetical protein